MRRLPKHLRRDQWVTFRVNQAEAEAIHALQIVRNGNNTKGKRGTMMRELIAGSGIIYVGNDFVDDLRRNRADNARLGNLLKMALGNLQQVIDNPDASDAEREKALNAIDEMTELSNLLRRISRREVQTLQKMNLYLEELRNNGNLQSRDAGGWASDRESETEETR